MSDCDVTSVMQSGARAALSIDRWIDASIHAAKGESVGKGYAPAGNAAPSNKKAGKKERKKGTRGNTDEKWGVERL